jgi:hypothetical protein
MNYYKQNIRIFPNLFCTKMVPKKYSLRHFGFYNFSRSIFFISRQNCKFNFSFSFFLQQQKTTKHNRISEKVHSISIFTLISIFNYFHDFHSHLINAFVHFQITLNLSWISSLPFGVFNFLCFSPRFVCLCID